MTMTDPVAYVLAQTKSNIEFLQSANQITPDDARVILERLTSSASMAPGPRNPVADVLAMPMANLSMGPSISAPEPPKPTTILPPPPSRSPAAPVSALSRPPPPIPASFLFKARAMWGYNENGSEADDLTFFEGDIIEILEDKNADWWKGRVRGKQGLFPSSYVQRIPDERPPPSHKVSSYSPAPPAPHNVYAPTYAPQAPYPAQNSYYAPPQGPPPPGPGYSSYQAPPPAAPAPPPAQEEPKKSGFLQGKLGNTLAHSAVGGVGFGAGSAVGSGIINSIF